MPTMNTLLQNGRGVGCNGGRFFATARSGSLSRAVLPFLQAVGCALEALAQELKKGEFPDSS